MASPAPTSAATSHQNGNGRPQSSNVPRQQQPQQAQYGNPPSKKEYYKKKEQADGRDAFQGPPAHGNEQFRGRRNRVERNGSPSNDPGNGNSNASHPATVNGEFPREQRRVDRNGARNRKDKDFRNQNGTQQPVAQQNQQAHPVDIPTHHVDQHRIEESARIQELISPPHIDPQHEALIAQIREVVGTELHSTEDIYRVLGQHGMDKDRTLAALLTEASEAHQRNPNVPWSEVVKKKPKTDNVPLPASNQLPNNKQVRPRRSKGDPEYEGDEQSHMEPRHPQPQAHQPGPHVSQHHQSPQPQHQGHPAQGQGQGQQVQHQLPGQVPHQQTHQHVQLQHQQQYEPSGDEILEQMSRMIQAQLEEISLKTNALMQMKSELQNIHSTGRDSLSNLISEKGSLLQRREQLINELHKTDERLKAVEIHIGQAESEKMAKLHELKRNFTPHLKHMITNG